jgi:hypothetical protein
LLEQVDSRFIERTRKNYYILPLRLCKQFFMPFPWSMSSGVKLVKRSLVAPWTVTWELKIISATIQRYSVGCIGLQLDCVSSSTLGRSNNLKSAIKISAMVT